MFRLAAVFFAASAGVLLVAGCETMDMKKIMKGDFNYEKYEPKYVVTVHRIVKYPRATELEKEITTFDGRKFWLNTNYFIHSSNIKEVKLLPRAGQKDFYDLALKLDRQGRMKWLQMSAHFRAEPMAVLVDGLFYRKFTPERISNEDDEWVEMQGPFDAVTGKGIEKYSKQNYEYYNPDPNALF